MGQCSKRKSIINHNSIGQAFTIFKDDLCPYIYEVRGKRVEIDFGDYDHIQRGSDGETRLKRIRYIRETLCNPEEIRKSISSGRRGRVLTEVYVNTIFSSESDKEGEPCLVIVEPRETYLRFKTFFIPDEKYSENVKRGEKIWP